MNLPSLVNVVVVDVCGGPVGGLFVGAAVVPDETLMNKSRGHNFISN